MLFIYFFILFIRLLKEVFLMILLMFSYFMVFLNVFILLVVKKEYIRFWGEDLVIFVNYGT